MSTNDLDALILKTQEVITQLYMKPPPSDEEIYEEKAYTSYPFEKARKGHNKAISEILNKNVAILCAPTGAGKTAIYLTAICELDARAVILTPRNVLQDQISKYNVGKELVPIYAKLDYCNKKTPEGAPLCKYKVFRYENGIRVPYILYNGELLEYPCDNCPYYVMLDKLREEFAKKSAIPVLNQGNLWIFRRDIEFVVIDEADELLSSFTDGIDYPLEENIEDPILALEKIKNLILHDIEEIMEKLTEPTLPQEKIAEYNNKLEELKRKLTKALFMKTYISDPMKLIVYKKSGKTRVEVIEEDIVDVAKRLYSNVERLLLVSATPGQSKADIISFNISFPKSAIIYAPIANLSYTNAKDNPEVFERAVKFIREIYEHVRTLTGATKTVIHTGNLKKEYAGVIHNLLTKNGYNVKVMEKKKQFESFQDFLKHNYHFFLVVAAEYGLDLREFPLQFVFKVPYADKKEPRIKAIEKRLGKEKFSEWYALDAFSRLIQECGRNIRDPQNFAVSIILDTCFEREFNRFESLIPNWFKERLICLSNSNKTS